MGCRPHWALLGVLAGGCFTGESTLGSVCREDGDCGGEQICVNQVCGMCGNGASQPGEVCFRTGESIALGPSPVTIRPIDVDRDDAIDLVALVPGTSELLVLRGAGRSFADPEIVVLPGVGFMFAVGDLDGDGTTDAIVSDAETIRLGRGSGSLAFSFGGESVAWPGATGLEMVLATEVSSAFAVASRPADGGGSELVALQIDVDGTLRIGAGVALTGEARPVASADLLGDGLPELVAVAGAQLLIMSGPELLTAATLDFSHAVGAVALVDVNGDGVRDVLTADQEGTVTIDLGDGSDGFDRQDSFSLPGPPMALIVGDLDRDGDRDIAAAGASFGVVLQLARGREYPETTVLTGPGSAADVLVADLDGDTLPELIVNSAAAGEIVILEVDP